MVKTQVQLPDAQYEKLKAFAAQREWSLAETLRRGVELILEVYPQTPSELSRPWTPPAAEGAGWKGLDAKALQAALADDLEPTMPARR
ncbi:MAG: antitoxin [Opitutales bacterium]